MERAELISNINSCLTPPCQIETYLGLKNGELKKANFESTTQKDFLETYTAVIKEKLISPEYDVIDYSKGENRSNTIYLYDLDKNDKFDAFEKVLDGESTIATFSFEEDGISNIKYLLLVIGNHEDNMVIYKNMANVNIYKKDSGFFIRKQDNLFTKINNDFLRIIPDIDIVKVDGKIFILNLKILEQNFDIHEIVKTEAKKQIKTIEESNLIEDVTSLTGDIENLTFARKLCRLNKESPVLGKVKNIEIIKFTKEHTYLKGVLKISDDGKKIKLTSKKSRLVLIKLLNDDFLTSRLTEREYDSLAKDTLVDNKYNSDNK